MASATNKLSAGMGATVALGNYLKNGLVNLKLAIPCMLAACVFSSVGAKVQMMIPEYYLKIFMLVALPLTLLMVLNKETLKSTKIFNIKLTKEVYIKSILISIVIGIYDGIYGPATGTFLLILVCGIFNMLGNYLGSNLFMKKGVDIARPIMITVMMIFLLRIVLELLHII